MGHFKQRWYNIGVCRLSYSMDDAERSSIPVWSSQCKRYEADTILEPSPPRSRLDRLLLPPLVCITCQVFLSSAFSDILQANEVC